MSSVSIMVNGEKKIVDIGTSLSQLLKMDLPCGGHGKCGKCKVKAVGALSAVCETELTHLSQEERDHGIRLACCTKVLGMCSVEEIHPKTEGSAVLTTGEIRQTDFHPAYQHFGVSVDIGTTTLAAKLLDRNGRVLSECGAANPQSIYGADVISRIESSMAGKGDSLAEVLTLKLDEMIQKMATEVQVDTKEIDGIVMTGNTTMLYLLTRTSPESLSHAPFQMTRGFGESIPASVLGLFSVGPEIEVYLPPCISAFVGADTVCALLASDLCASEKPVMLADIGTNGEMALWNQSLLTVCSTAAGPALEGVGISMGMPGSKGAIDQVYLKDGAYVAHVIGDVSPVGICGSGLVDAVATLLENETIDETGFLEEDEVTISSPVVLTQKDIRMVQLAKSAICAGMKTLIHEAGLQEKQIERLDIAGGFGNYLNKKSATQIGLWPSEFLTIANSIGNGALSGATLLLTNQDFRKKAEELAQSAITIDLSASPYFSDEYLMGMTFPEADS